MSPARRDSATQVGAGELSAADQGRGARGDEQPAPAPRSYRPADPLQPSEPDQPRSDLNSTNACGLPEDGLQRLISSLSSPVASRRQRSGRGELRGERAGQYRRVGQYRGWHSAPAWGAHRAVTERSSCHRSRAVDASFPRSGTPRPRSHAGVGSAGPASEAGVVTAVDMSDEAAGAVGLPHTGGRARSC